MYQSTHPIPIARLVVDQPLDRLPDMWIVRRVCPRRRHQRIAPQAVCDGVLGPFSAPGSRTCPPTPVRLLTRPQPLHGIPNPLPSAAPPIAAPASACSVDIIHPPPEPAVVLVLFLDEVDRFTHVCSVVAAMPHALQHAPVMSDRTDPELRDCDHRRHMFQDRLRASVKRRPSLHHRSASPAASSAAFGARQRHAPRYDTRNAIVTIAVSSDIQ